jgi:uncharacterized protein
MTHATRLLVLLPLAIAAARELRAATFPPHTDNHVNDFADVIPPEDEARIRERGREVLSKTAVPIVAVTISSLAGQGAGDWTVERYAAGLYNDWGIGSADKNLGILFLVAVKDRKLRIQTGAGYGTSWDEPARRIIDSDVVPRFRRGDLAGGITAGIEAIATEVLAASGRAARGAPEPAPPLTGGEGGRWQPRGTGIGPPGKSGGGMGTLIFIGFIVIAGLAVLSVLRGLARGVGGALGGGGWTPGPRMSGSGWGGWGGLLAGGLLGYAGSRLFDRMSHRHHGGGSWGGSGGGNWGGGSLGGGGGSSGGSSFGGGYSSGGGASGSW